MTHPENDPLLQRLAANGPLGTPLRQATRLSAITRYGFVKLPLGVRIPASLSDLMRSDFVMPLIRVSARANTSSGTVKDDEDFLARVRSVAMFGR